MPVPNPRSMTFHLFEVSWETCNKLGGIHTVISSKARTLVERLDDRYVAIGPMLLDEKGRESTFEEKSGHEAFQAACRKRGLSVRVGRWAAGGNALTILVGYSDLYKHKDDVLSALWEDYSVDSIRGGFEYVEPVLFGHAAAIAIEEWWRLTGEPEGDSAVAQFHEWTSAAGLLHLHRDSQGIGTIFTAHATMLGRTLSLGGTTIEEALDGRSPSEAAEDAGIAAKHSLENAAIREADVFTTVSSVTGTEAELLHQRKAEPVLPNGLDLELLDSLADAPNRAEVRARLARIAGALVGEDVADAAFLAISGRYEFHNKGLDVLLTAVAALEGQPGRRVVLFVLMPTGSSVMTRDLRLRIEGEADWDGSLGLSTHEIFDSESDPLHQRCAALGLENAVGSRVKIVQVPAYLPDGGLLDMAYETVLGAMELACFPSAYEPWGYTPAEAIGVGVPTLTTDCAGFAKWAQEQGLGSQDGIHVIARERRSDNQVATDLTLAIEGALASERPGGELRSACRTAAERLSWEHLIEPYEKAFGMARTSAKGRGGSSYFPLKSTAVPRNTQHDSEPRLMRFDACASLPPALSGLSRLARNLWWCWNPEAKALFHDISPRLWAAVEQNPVVFLRQAWPADLEKISEDTEYLARLDAVLARFDNYMAESARTVDHGGAPAVSPSAPIAYFCFEFGLHPSLPIYSGGLGVLAGDHLKSASDCNLPLVAMGLFYRGGYVRQHLLASGEQQNLERHNDPEDLPIKPCLDDQGEPIEVSIQLPAGPVRLRAWEANVGRVRLFLLDSDVAGNPEELRSLTRRLYSGDSEHRLRQEITLGKGGVRMLAALGIQPSVVHMNEGHAGFAALERVATLVREENLTFAEASEVVRAGTVFTTHTPVPAGHDVFDEELIRRYFTDSAGWVGLPWEAFMALGCDAHGEGGFNMTYLCMNLAAFVNGVAKKHGEVSRGLLHPYWAGLLESEVPVTHVTNGVHLPTWTAPEISACLGVEGRHPQGSDFAKANQCVDPAQLWAARQSLKQDLMSAVAANLERTFTRRQDDPKLLVRTLENMDANALVIGFARRFAPYKRANLLLADRERLARLVNDAKRPVRFLFSGKAHPADVLGQELVNEVASLCREDDFVGRIIFLEDYDMHIAAHLTQGVDVWLNNPIPPLEASGTSGMKSAANGGLNLSVLDGWWLEGCDDKNGWGIGPEITFTDQQQQNLLDNEQLLRLLEDEVLPLYYERNADGLPAAWLERSIHALATLPPFFGTDRMVEEYLARGYAPRAAAARQQAAGGFALARDCATETRRLERGFEEIHILDARVGDLTSINTGDTIEVALDVSMGSLKPADLIAELVLGHPSGERSLHKPNIVELTPGEAAHGTCTFKGAHIVKASGTYGWGIRVRPRPIAATSRQLPGLVRWA